MATLQTITARYQGLRGTSHRIAKDTLQSGKYYYVVIYRKLKYRYEFIGEFLECDSRDCPIFAYESNISNKKCRWYCKPNDAIYELTTDVLPEPVRAEIHNHGKPLPAYRCDCL